MKRYLRLAKNVSNWWRYLGGKAGLVREDPLRFRLANGIRIEVPRRLMHEFKEIYMEECYSRKRMRPLPQNPAIVDVGANVGFFSLFAASRHPGARIAAVEPIPVNFGQLEKNAGLNPGAGVTLVQAAVYDKSGTIELSFEDGGDFTTAASVVAHPASRTRSLAVPCFSLAGLLDKLNMARCDLLKMDCEGAEYDALYGSDAQTLWRFDQMVIEVHRRAEASYNIAALSRFVEQNGFDTRQDGDILYTARRT